MGFVFRLRSRVVGCLLLFVVKSLLFAMFEVWVFALFLYVSFAALVWY